MGLLLHKRPATHLMPPFMAYPAQRDYIESIISAASPSTLHMVDITRPTHTTGQTILLTQKLKHLGWFQEPLPLCDTPPPQPQPTPATQCSEADHSKAYPLKSSPQQTKPDPDMHKSNPASPMVYLDRKSVV
jgi:hypothetical protein